MHISKFIKQSYIGMIALVFGFAITALITHPASAATNPYTPQGVCGAGYSVQRSQVLNGATVYQLYNGSYNCVVTIKTAQVGTPTRTTAGIQVTGASWAYDTGEYKYFAGPVKQYGKGKCVRYFGYHGGKSYTSPWGNCG